MRKKSFYDKNNYMDILMKIFDFYLLLMLHLQKHNN